jgi:hypothetical protein
MEKSPLSHFGVKSLDKLSIITVSYVRMCSYFKSDLKKQTEGSVRYRDFVGEIDSFSRVATRTRRADVIERKQILCSYMSFPHRI